MIDLLSSLETVHFANPGWLLLVLVFPALFWWRRRHQRPAIPFAPAKFLDDLPRSWRQRLSRVPPVLGVVGLLCAILAMARPVVTRALPRETEGIDVLLCLDVSSSMASTDMDPRRTRLDVAKDAAQQFIAGREKDRIGLVSFARYPDIACPLTLRHDTVQDFLGRLELVEADGPEDATGIGAAIARAVQVLGRSQAKSKVVILLTDGEETVATNQSSQDIGPAEAAQIAKQYGVRVYTVVAGIGGLDNQGAIIPLQTGAVKQLAEVTNGHFFEVRDAGAMTRVYSAIDALEKSPFSEQRYRQEDRFLPFLLLALGCMGLELLLRRGGWEVIP